MLKHTHRFLFLVVIATTPLKVGACAIEVVQLKNQAVKQVKLLRPGPSRRFLVA
ncbi:hypothetical protein [Massilia sp. IC2-476]|uniref:hypothetical protein n=1 Tax=Massilia sp. IC2-476 TaxID=2887199 RepID=UPI001D11FAAA|nr:hypothetical protein [Massilia sp. IC2-476]MCC2971592.1 hypothetical protein [Massilia sp. IC2-476]